MKFEVRVNVLPQKALLDPQGRAVQHAIEQMGYAGVDGVRIGKHIVLHIEANTEDEVRRVANELCSRLLSNPVMEGFEFTIVPYSAC